MGSLRIEQPAGRFHSGPSRQERRGKCSREGLDFR